MSQTQYCLNVFNVLCQKQRTVPSNKALSQSSSKGIPLSRSSWGRDSSGFLRPGAPGEGIPYRNSWFQYQCRVSELLQRDSSIYELLRRGFLTQIVDFSNEALSQSSSKWIPLSRNSWGRDFSPKLLISVKMCCLRAHPEGLLCLGGEIQWFTKQNIYCAYKSGKNAILSQSVQCFEAKS